MCGIIGLIYPQRTWEKHKTTVYKVDYKNFMEQAVYVGAVRGANATGLLYVEKTRVEAKKEGQDVNIFKRAYSGTDFIQLGEVQSVLRNIEYNWVTVIHHRLSTNNASGHAAAHPFQHKHITLVHNGIITNAHKLPATPVNIDSDRVAAGLAETQDIENFLGNLSGSFVLVWYDTNTNTINFIRNKERPLFFYPLLLL